jgi:hypothetical protein
VGRECLTCQCHGCSATVTQKRDYRGGGRPPFWRTLVVEWLYPGAIKINARRSHTTARHSHTTALLPPTPWDPRSGALFLINARSLTPTRISRGFFSHRPLVTILWVRHTNTTRNTCRRKWGFKAKAVNRWRRASSLYSVVYLFIYDVCQDQRTAIQVRERCGCQPPSVFVHEPLLSNSNSPHKLSHDCQ